MQKWKENIRSIEPYIPGEQPQFSDMIKLNTNERSEERRVGKEC